MSYTKPSLSGYNASPPPDDGTTGSDNEITWSKHKTKLGDPLQTFSNAINDAVESAWKDADWPIKSTATYISSSTFSVTDTTDFHTGRRVKTSEDAYGAITDVSGTTITVELSSGSLTASLASVQLGPAADSTSASVQYYPVISAETSVTNTTYYYDDPRRFGAVGDGVTDDTIAVKNCISSRGGRSVFIATGQNYLIDVTSAGLVLSVDKTILIGGGEITAVNSTNHLISVTASSCKIEGVSIVGDGTFTSDKAVADADRIALIKVTGNNNDVVNCRLTNGHQNFIHYSAVTGGKIANNKLFGGITTYDITTDTAYQGIRAVDCAFLDIRSNEVSALGGGKTAESIYVSINSTTASNNINITNNVVHDAWDHGIYLNLSHACTVSNNITNTDAAGIVCASLFDVTLANTYQGNVCTSNTVIASTTRTGSIGLFVRDANGTICDNNSVRGFPTSIQLSAVSYSDANLTINNNSISNNICTGWTTSGINISAAGKTVGEVSGNRIEGNTLIGTNDVAGKGISSVFAAGILAYNSYSRNILSNCGDYGIITQYDTGSTISDNKITNPAVSGATNKTGVSLLYAVMCSIENNTVEDNLATPEMLYGISGNNTSDNCVVRNNLIKNAQTVPIRQFQFSGHKNTFTGNKTGTDALTGYVTLAAATTTTVTNNNINVAAGMTSRVSLIPTNQDAATLLGSANHPYIGDSDFVAGTSFVIRGAGAALGTETFYYEIVQ